LSIKEVIKDTLEKLKEIDKAITGLQQDIKRYEYTLKLAEEEEYDVGQLAAYQMQKQQLEKAIEESKVKHNELKAEEELASFWKAAWSPTGIPSMLIDESIPFMNKKVSQYLDRLSNGRYIVSFDTLAETKAGEFRDKISVNVLDTYTRANSRIQLSGGQTRLVDIATILTLGDLQSNIQDVNINILLFDEIFDSLDEENIGFVANILNQLKIGKSIYLISHTQVDQLEADEILELK
jgi:exonuclease SbcC